MLKYLTAGESHGPALLATIDGIPSHVEISVADIEVELARRRLGYGRGARMQIEADEVRILSGLRHGETIGSPIAIEVANSEWESWSSAMSPAPISQEAAKSARNTPLTKPRPGHADLTGMAKYDFDEARPVLERASARETAARVALGAVAKQFLSQCAGISIISHVVQLGGVSTDVELPTIDQIAQIDASPVRCVDETASLQMVEHLDRAKASGETVGGIVEVVAWGVVAGLGSYSQADRRLDGALAGALMSIPAIKGVGIGQGFEVAATSGSQVHDEMAPTTGGIKRITNHAGGIEGGMSNGSPIWLRIAMKPIPTLTKALHTVDLATHESAPAHHQRSDTCAVPAVGVVAEAVVALVLADAFLSKFGGDSLGEVKRNLAGYTQQLKDRQLEIQ